MALLVQKFGGTSVGTPERICAVAQRIAKSYALGHSLVIVVSAMGNSTDKLIQLAKQVSVSPPPRREMDMLLSVGERTSMALLSMALADLKVPALSLTGSQSGIITDESHQRARIQKILGDRIRSALKLRQVVIVAGFQGVSASKEVTTLGRGGSDTTAVALAAALKAQSCEIFTDVEGVFSADPRQIPSARLWSKIPDALMVELANRGAGVLHPRSVELAKKFHVPLSIKSSFMESKGTDVISVDPLRTGMEDFDIAGITADPEKFFLKITLSRENLLGALWDRAATSHLSILSPSMTQGHITFFSDREGEKQWRRHLDFLLAEGYLKDYECCLEIIPLSIVGNRFAQDGMALCDVFNVLSHQSVPVLALSATSMVITVGIPSTHARLAIQALHAHWFPQEEPPVENRVQDHR